MDEIKHTAPKKVINGWAMYDWAASVYNLVITTTFFPIYFVTLTDAPPFNGKIYFLGRYFVNTSLYNYALAAAYLAVAVSLPILTSIADTRGNKLNFMKFFCAFGALSCAGLYFFTADHVTLGIYLMMAAAYGFYCSVVFYNSYLPDIAATKDQDWVSAKGFSLGYIGSVILQTIGFALVMFWNKIPFFHNEGDAVRFTFLLTGLWWIGFAQITFKVLPKGIADVREGKGSNVFTTGFRELKAVFNQVKKMPALRRFLLAFFSYIMGVLTVMMVATNFGIKILKMSATNLIIAVVLIQLVAVLGAWLMSKLSDKIGDIYVLMIALVLWIGVCVAAYFIQTEMQFYILAVVVGLLMGGTQTMSRSTYSKLLPPTTDTASFFSFYDVTEKLAMVIGLFSFGFIEEKTGNMRYSAAALTFFFVLGLVFLWATKQALKKTPSHVS